MDIEVGLVRAFRQEIDRDNEIAKPEVARNRK